VALWFYDYSQYHDLMVFTQISKFQECTFNAFLIIKKLGDNKILLILASFGE
jgi:hypothetical protein